MANNSWHMYMQLYKLVKPDHIEHFYKNTFQDAPMSVGIPTWW